MTVRYFLSLGVGKASLVCCWVSEQNSGTSRGRKPPQRRQPPGTPGQTRPECLYSHLPLCGDVLQPWRKTFHGGALGPPPEKQLRGPSEAAGAGACFLSSPFTAFASLSTAEEGAHLFAFCLFETRSLYAAQATPELLGSSHPPASASPGHHQAAPLEPSAAGCRSPEACGRPCWVPLGLGGQDGTC